MTAALEIAAAVAGVLLVITGIFRWGWAETEVRRLNRLVAHQAIMAEWRDVPENRARQQG